MDELHQSRLAELRRDTAIGVDQAERGQVQRFNEEAAGSERLPSPIAAADWRYNTNERRNCSCRAVVASLIMPNMKRSSTGYQIDGRVSIALDALNAKQKQDVTRVITDRRPLYRKHCGPPKGAQDLEE